MAKVNMTLEEKLNEAIVKDVPYDVPRNWVWVKVKGIILDTVSGFACSKTFEVAANEVDAYPHLRPNNIGYYGKLNLDKVVYIPKEKVDNKKSKLLKGEILFNNTNSTELVGRAIIIHEDMDVAFSNHITKISVNKDLCKGKFLNYAINYNWCQGIFAKACKQWVGQSGINQDVLKDEIYVPLPPLNEQKRIVDRIESIFEKLDKAKELIEESREGFENRKAAILEKAFRGELTSEWRKINKKLHSGEELFATIKEKRLSLSSSNKEKRDIELLFDNYNFTDIGLPPGWIKLKSAMICELITCGKTPTGNIVSHGDVAFLKVYNIVDNKVDFEYKPQFIDYDTHSKKLKSSMLKPNDVIMNIVGPPLRKIAIIPDTYNDWNMNQAIVRFRAIEYIDYKFIYYCLIYDDTLKEVINETRGVVGQANISVSQSRNLNIIVPSTEEQKEIVRRLDKLLEDEFKIEELTQLEEQVELIKKSILAKAFRGELGTNCEEDGSALELLKGILSEN